MRIASDALVCICEGVVCLRINDRPHRLFFQHAMCRLCIPHDSGSRLKPGIIKRVPGIRILGHLNMLGRLFEALDIGSAGSDFNIVVQYSVEDADWMVRDFGVADVSRGARPVSYTHLTLPTKRIV